MPYNFKDTLSLIAQNAMKPPLFEPGEPHFWDDPHISKSMLEAHLNPNHDAASRRPEKIDDEVNHLISSGLLKSGYKVLDLGCGPGLYASRMAAKGIKITGIDISENSLNYAIAQASSSRQDINYRRLNFFEMDYSCEFDVVFQAYGEMGTFSDEKRDELLRKIHTALKSGGLLIFDVTAPPSEANTTLQNPWYISDAGFWRPGRHLTLEQHFNYLEDNVHVEQYIVVDDKGITVYRTWIHDYTLESLTPVLEKAGFHIEHTWNDLAGNPYKKGGEWLAIAAKKR